MKEKHKGLPNLATTFHPQAKIQMHHRAAAAPAWLHVSYI